MPRFRSIPRLALLALLALGGASCAGDAASGVAGTATLRLGTAGKATLLQCDPAAAGQSVTGLIGPQGGVLAIGNTRVVIPELAVLQPTDFTLTVPASRLVEISVRAGSAQHFVFERPVLVSIDYGRCASGLSPLRPVSAWYIDESSKALLERMPSLDLRAANTVTFQTGHLSGYAVAD